MQLNESTMQNITVFLPLILFFFILWFFLLRPQRKKEKETKMMRDSLAVGDKIVTIGGIVGTIMKVKEDSLVVYVGADKTKIEFMKWAVAQLVVKNDKAAKDESKAESDQKSVDGSKIKRLKKKDGAEEENTAAE